MVDESFREEKVAGELVVLAVSCQQPLEVFIFCLINKCNLEPAGSETGRAGEVWQGERDSTERTEGTVAVRFWGSLSKVENIGLRLLQ